MAAATLAEDSSALETTAHLVEPSRHFVAEESISIKGDKMAEEMDYESLPSDNLSAHLLAGGAAGIMEHCVMYPVDCIKTRMMQLSPNPEATYTNLIQAFRTITTTESPRVLFRGISVVATGAGPAHAMYFSLYEVAKKRLSKKLNNNGVLAQGGAGALATVAHDAFMNPVDVLKQRLQVYNSPYRGAFDCFGTVFRNEGPRAFYRSFTTQLTMNIPFQVLHFVSYEFLQDLLNPSREYHPLSHSISGAGAGACAAALTTPLDVAKTFLNTQEQRKESGKVKGMMRTMVRIYQISGFRGYFKGLSARVVYQMPSTAICWSVYEFFKYALGLKGVAADSDIVLQGGVSDEEK